MYDNDYLLNINRNNYQIESTNYKFILQKKINENKI